MCEPVTIGMGVMAATSAALSIAGQQKQKSTFEALEKQKANTQDDAIAETRRRATQDYLRQTQAERQQQAIEEQAVAEKGYDIGHEAHRAEATAEASAAERNVTGNTIQAVVADYDYQADFEIGRIKENQKLRNLQHRNNLTVMKDQYEQRASSLKPYVPKPANPVDYFGPIFGAVAQTANVASQSPEIRKSIGEAFSTSNLTLKGVMDTPQYSDTEADYH